MIQSIHENQLIGFRIEKNNLGGFSVLVMIPNRWNAEGFSSYYAEHFDTLVEAHQYVADVVMPNLIRE